MAGAPPRVLKKGSLEAMPAPAKADELLAEALDRARGIVAVAEAEAERLRVAAAKEGYLEGMGRAAAALALAAEVRDATLAELDGAVVDVALEIAHRVVGRALGTTPDAVVGVASRALRAAAGCGDVVLRVGPGDLETIRGASGVLERLIERGSLAVAEDPTLVAGEVIVESAGGRVDARIGAQLEAFRRALEMEGR